MAVIIKANGGWHLRMYSNVDLRNGQPLEKRKQQSILLARVDDGEFKSEDSLTLQELSIKKQREIETWEKQMGDSASPGNSNMNIAVFFKTVFLPKLKIQVSTGQKTHSTEVAYKRYWNCYLEDELKDKTFRSYQSHQAATFLHNLRKDDGTLLGANTVRHIHATASGVFSLATELGYVQTNIWRDVKTANAPASKIEKSEIHDEQDVLNLIKAIEVERGGRADWNNQLAQIAIAIGLYAGCRPSETCALDWSDIDFENATIRINKAYVYGKHKTETKTGKDRIIPYLDQLTPILRRWHAVCGSPSRGLVLPNRDNQPANMNTLANRIIKPIAEKTGLEWHDFYALRRGFGTLLVKQGWNCEEVAQAMGNTRDVVWQFYFVDHKCELAANARDRIRNQMRDRMPALPAPEHEPLMLET